jgi:hypothetical protein
MSTEYDNEHDNDNEHEHDNEHDTGVELLIRAMSRARSTIMSTSERRARVNEHERTSTSQWYEQWAMSNDARATMIITLFTDTIR